MDIYSTNETNKAGGMYHYAVYFLRCLWVGTITNEGVPFLVGTKKVVVTAGEEENNTTIGANIGHIYYQCKIPWSQFAIHLQNCTNLIIPTLPQTLPTTLTLLHTPIP